MATGDVRRSALGTGTHYAFDAWMVREFPSITFERYCDDAVVHCRSESQAHRVRDAIAARLAHVGIDLHRQRSVIVRQTDADDPASLALAGYRPEVVLEATYGWYWAVDALQAAGANVHLAHPLEVRGFRYRRV
ncbi:hypothetical protein ACFTZB_21515 [Rhodococcus sp. NPDC057014]|uniref:hypothetical protein n=1 Tax=Rhodococcus sp. NPDC057014 TaxID=3346000 RepID=UPI00362579EF